MMGVAPAVMKAVWWSPNMYSATHSSVAEWIRYQAAKCKVHSSIPTSPLLKDCRLQVV